MENWLLRKLGFESSRGRKGLEGSPKGNRGQSLTVPPRRAVELRQKALWKEGKQGERHKVLRI